MKKFLVFVLAVAVSVSVVAQKASVKKPKADPKLSRKEIRVTARNVAAEVRAPLTDAEHAVALRVHVGTLPCELGQVVELQPDSGTRGFFNLRLGKTGYHVAPEETTTGAIRLEDKAAGIVWLQLANKSMLMSQKLGIRLADECMSPAQVLVAQAMILNPPPSVLDAPAPPSPSVPASSSISSPDATLPPSSPVPSTDAALPVNPTEEPAPKE